MIDRSHEHLWLAHLRRVLVMVALSGVACLPRAALAWGAEGHRLIAEMAMERLTPAARAQAEALLQLEPGATLGSSSTWADEVRSPRTAAWHYVNFPRDGGCHYDALQMCPQGQCVVAAITAQLEVLASQQPADERLLALKYVVHFIADIHQPLHAGFADDKGGNTFQLQAAGRGTNLHAVWDSGLIRGWPGGLPALRLAMDRAPAGSPGSDPQRWAEDACRIVSQPDFYPTTRTPGDSYAERWSAQLPAQLAAAAQHLAGALNVALGR